MRAIHSGDLILWGIILSLVVLSLSTFSGTLACKELGYNGAFSDSGRCYNKVYDDHGTYELKGYGYPDTSKYAIIFLSIEGIGLLILIAIGVYIERK